MADHNESIAQHSTVSRAKSRSKRLRAHVDYQAMSVSYGRVKLSVPNGFKEMLENVTREILREQPRNIPAFLQVYFESLYNNQKEGHLVNSLVTERIVEINGTVDAETQDRTEQQSTDVQTSGVELVASESQTDETNAAPEEQAAEEQPAEQAPAEEATAKEATAEEAPAEETRADEDQARDNRSVLDLKSSKGSVQLGEVSQTRIEESQSTTVVDLNELKSATASKTRSLQDINNERRKSSQSISTELILKASAEELATEVQEKSLEEKDAELHCQEIDCNENQEIPEDADEPIDQKKEPEFDASPYEAEEAPECTNTPQNSMMSKHELSFEEIQKVEHDDTIAEAAVEEANEDVNEEASEE